MSTLHKCITTSEKFNSLKEIIEEYYCLVKENPIELPPYAKFKVYLVDDENCGKEKCIDRPKRVRELVDKLISSEENEKIETILELWSHGGEIYVSDIPELYRFPKIIHSVSNTTRLQVFLKGGKKDNDKGVVVNKDILLKFATVVAEYIQSFQNAEVLKDNPIRHNLTTNENFKDLIENNINSVINELLFWYYYSKDKYPIINRRAKTSRHILNKVFGLKINKDLDFNNECLKYIGEPRSFEEKKFISKQLMLDQLFYSIDLNFRT